MLASRSKVSDSCLMGLQFFRDHHFFVAMSAGFKLVPHINNGDLWYFSTFKEEECLSSDCTATISSKCRFCKDLIKE